MSADSPVVAADDAAPHARRPPRLAEGDVVRRYTIRALLGAGGMGEVYRAFDPELQREVAIKMIVPEVGGISLEARARFLREAQALASLNHPNVVAVYDTGTHHDQVFVAMELVNGLPLSTWMKYPRGWREVRDVFLAAGRGLAAAHAAAIIHRDFKPHNVIVGDGRVVVLDFGLARRGDELDCPSGESFPAGEDPALTRTGDLIGTPAYMAPEQLEGRSVGEWSDQFSFCLTLFEALYGRRPFSGGTIFELAQSRRHPIELPAGRRVPRWLSALVQRGLAFDPARRHPSMAALLRALGRAPWRRSRVALLGGGLVAGVCAAAVLGVTRPARPTCAGGSLAGVWDDGARAALRASFAAVDKPFALDTFERTAAVLDGRAAAWRQARVEACEATMVRGEQSAALMDLRMLCLDRRRAELAGLVRALGDGLDADGAADALEAAVRLPPIAACADARALSARVPLPDAPEARRAALALDDQIARLEAMASSAQATALRRQLALAGVAAAHPYAPLRTRGQMLLARERRLADDHVAAQLHYERAIRSAVEARDDALGAEAWSELLGLRMQQGKYKEATDLWLSADTAVVRAGDEPAQRVYLDSRMAASLRNLARYDEAAVRVDHAVAVARTLPPTDGALAVALHEAAQLAWRRGGDYAEFLRLASEEVAAAQRAYGPRHVKVGDALRVQGVAYAVSDRSEEALDSFGRALAIARETRGEGSVMATNIMMQMANVQGDLGHPDEAAALYERLAPIIEQRLGRDHPDLGTIRINLAIAYQDLGRLADARAQLALAAQNIAVTLPPDHPKVASLHKRTAELDRAEGHFADMLREYQAALAIDEAKVGPTSSILVESLVGIGDALVLLRRPGDALAYLERGVAIAVVAKGSPAGRGQARFALARALLQVKPGARERAVGLAGEALRDFQEIGDGPSAAAAQAWLTAHAR